MFRRGFWALVDNKLPLQSIYIVSQEPYVPWELMVPTRRRPDGTVEEWDRPIGAEYAVGRWVKELFLSPRQKIPLTDAMTVAPEYPGKRGLKHAAAEIKWLAGGFT